jgi:uncharacterized membrane protein
VFDIDAITVACIQKRRQGADFTALRKELESQGLPDDVIRKILRTVDDDERQQLTIKQKNNTAANKKTIRLTVSIITISLLVGMIVFLGGLPVFATLLILIIWGRIFFWQ